MSDEEFEAEIVKRVGMDRRTFVRRLLLSGAFAVPVIASFDMSTLTMASAAANTPNGTVSRTKLVATGAVIEIVHGTGYVLEFFDLNATLTTVTPPAPVAGQQITFSTAGHKLGTATTDGQGTATLSVRTDLADIIDIIQADGYKAHFAGTPTLKPSSAQAGLVASTGGPPG